jgi:hypothetical protein
MDGRRTFEDFFDMKKKDLKAYLKEVGLKISGNIKSFFFMSKKSSNVLLPSILTYSIYSR